MAAAEGFFINSKISDSIVILMGLGSLSEDDAEILADSLFDWVKKGFAIDENSDDLLNYPEFIDVYFTCNLLENNKLLLDIKKILNLPHSIAELKKLASNPPYRILHKVAFWKYAKLCFEINQINNCLEMRKVNNSNILIPFPPEII